MRRRWFCLLEFEIVANHICDGGTVCLYDQTVDDHLVEDEMGDVETEHDVELADGVEERIERDKILVNELEHALLVLERVHAHDEEERCVASVHRLVVAELHHGALSRVSSEALAHKLGLHCDLLRDAHLDVVLGHSSLSLLIHNQHIPQHLAADLLHEQPFKNKNNTKKKATNKKAVNQSDNFTEIILLSKPL